MAEFRPNVALLLVDGEDRLLVCERLNATDSWQFPQGGVDPGESTEEALGREVEEEIGLPPASYEILESRGGYRYLFPDGVKKRIKGTKEWYAGQEQTYFLCRVLPGVPPVDVHQEAKEFQEHKWIRPEEFRLGWLPEFKREVYRAVMKDFFGVAL